MIGLRRAARFALVVALGLALAVPLGRAQDEAAALDAQFNALYSQGKFTEAIPLAERYVELARAQHGENHPDYAGGLSNLARALHGANRLVEAEANYRRAIVADETSLGASHADLAADLKGLAELLQDTSQYAEAEALYRRALAIDEGNFGPNDARVGDDLHGLAQVLKVTNRLAEAEPIMRRALAVTEAASGPGHPDVAIRLSSLAALLLDANRLAEAETLMRRATVIDLANFGPNHQTTALRIGNLAQILVAKNELAEAEPLIRQALQIIEAQLGPDDERVAGALTNLASLLRTTNRPTEAEPLIRRALAIDEAQFGPDHPRVALHVNNLAQVLMDLGRRAEAEPLMRRSLATNEARFGPGHPTVARNLNNLAQLLKAQNRPAEAEPLLRRAVAIDEANFGPSHPNVAGYVSNLAQLLKETDRAAEAEPLMRRVIAIFEEGLGPDHPNVAIGLSNLALLLAERGDWTEALDLIRRCNAIRVADARRNAASSADATQRFAQQMVGELKFQVLSIFETHTGDRAGLNESFIAAQSALATEAASALAEASARFAAGTGSLAAVVREAQDAARERAAADRNLLAALAKADKPAADTARAEETRLDARLDAIAGRLAADFPEYTALANPEPLSVEVVQALLKPNEVLVQFLDLPAFLSIPETGFVWAITKKDVRWASTGHGALGLTGFVSVLRCGLDATNWTNAARWPEATADQKQRKADQLARRERCKILMGIDAKDTDTPPFDLARAHQLYQSLFGEIEDVIKGKQLLIVPSGPLTSLPFQTLVTREPALAIPADTADYAKAAWLGLEHAITVLPSVASLQALRKFARGSKAPQPFAGFGNPLLTGPSGTDTSASAKQTCGQPNVADITGSIAARAVGRDIAEVGRGHLANLEALRRQWPLPETADEVCSVAKSLGAPASAVHLGRNATETLVKALSADGALRKAGVLHFATHGLLAGETRMVASALAEPALLLTPPDVASDDDDGLLTASEVAQLQIDADWVVLSACNTAAAGANGAEAFSGLARAFFYAGARALLVSHWYVDSEATLALITTTFAALKANPRIGRAEALRRAMATLIAEGEGREHPAKWAPFVVVGEGGAPAPR